MSCINLIEGIPSQWTFCIHTYTLLWGYRESGCIKYAEKKPRDEYI